MKDGQEVRVVHADSEDTESRTERLRFRSELSFVVPAGHEELGLEPPQGKLRPGVKVKVTFEPVQYEPDEWDPDNTGTLDISKVLRG